MTMIDDGAGRGRRTRTLTPPSLRGLGGLLLGAALAGAVLAGPARAQQFTGDAFARLQKLEEEIRRLNGRVEQLEHQLRQASEDAGRRFNDMEFRLTELEGGDTSLVGDPAPLGQSGGNGAPAVAISEQAAFDRGVAAVRNDDYRRARDELTLFLAEYGDGPLAAEAEYWLGEAHFRAGESRLAAQTFLSNVTGRPNGKYAAQSLLKLALSLGQLGQRGEACLTLDEVARRYPSASDAIAQAKAEKRRLKCK